MLPLFDALLVQQISVLVTGAGLLFFVQLLLNALPLLHERRHFDFSLLRLEKQGGQSDANHAAVKWSARPTTDLILLEFLSLVGGKRFGRSWFRGGLRRW